MEAGSTFCVREQQCQRMPAKRETVNVIRRERAGMHAIDARGNHQYIMKDKGRKRGTEKDEEVYLDRGDGVIRSIYITIGNL